MTAHVFHSLVQLLERVIYSLWRLDGDHGLPKLAPCRFLIVLRKVRLAYKQTLVTNSQRLWQIIRRKHTLKILDDQLLRRCSRLIHRRWRTFDRPIRTRIDQGEIRFLLIGTHIVGFCFFEALLAGWKRSFSVLITDLRGRNWSLSYIRHMKAWYSYSHNMYLV